MAPWSSGFATSTATSSRVREAQSIRDAADARLFGDADQIEAVTAALEMMDTLVEAARLSSRTSRELGDLLCSDRAGGRRRVMIPRAGT